MPAISTSTVLPGFMEPTDSICPVGVAPANRSPSHSATRPSVSVPKPMPPACAKRSQRTTMIPPDVWVTTPRLGGGRQIVDANYYHRIFVMTAEAGMNPVALRPMQVGFRATLFLCSASAQTLWSLYIFPKLIAVNRLPGVWTPQRAQYDAQCGQGQPARSCSTKAPTRWISPAAACDGGQPDQAVEQRPPRQSTRVGPVGGFAWQIDSPPNFYESGATPRMMKEARHREAAGRGDPCSHGLPRFARNDNLFMDCRACVVARSECDAAIAMTACCLICNLRY